MLSLCPVVLLLHAAKCGSFVHTATINNRFASSPSEATVVLIVLKRERSSSHSTGDMARALPTLDREAVLVLALVGLVSFMGRHRVILVVVFVRMNCKGT